MVLILSITRSKKKLRTFLLSFAATMLVCFMVGLSIFFIPANNTGALSKLAVDTGRMAGIVTAFIYSQRTREDAPQSVYLIAISCAVFSLVSLVLENF